MGGWVEVNAPTAPVDKPADLSEVFSGGRALSSFDLLRGIEIDERADAAVDELFDQLFPSPKRADPDAWRPGPKPHAK